MKLIYSSTILVIIFILASCKQEYYYFQSKKIGIYIDIDSNQYLAINKNPKFFTSRLPRGQGFLDSIILIDKYLGLPDLCDSLFIDTIQKNHAIIQITDINGNSYSSKTAYFIYNNDTVDLSKDLQLHLTQEYLSNKIVIRFYNHSKEVILPYNFSNYNYFRIKINFPCSVASNYFDLTGKNFKWINNGIVIENDTCILVKKVKLKEFP
jgi:hypothetical protein